MNDLSGWLSILLENTMKSQMSLKRLLYRLVFYTIYGLYLCDIQVRIRRMKINQFNQYGITMATHYDITMGNGIVQDAHCEITMGNGVARDIHCDVTMSNDIAMYKYNTIHIQNVFIVL